MLVTQLKFTTGFQGILRGQSLADLPHKKHVKQGLYNTVNG